MSLFHIRLTFGIYIRYVLRNNKNNQCDRAYLYNNFSALLFERLCFNVDAITLWTTFIYSSTPAPHPYSPVENLHLPPPPIQQLLQSLSSSFKSCSKGRVPILLSFYFNFTKFNHNNCYDHWVMVKLYYWPGIRSKVSRVKARKTNNKR